MQIPWTVHLPQAMQQHGANRTSPAEVAEVKALDDLKCQSGWPNRAEDAASRIIPADRPSMP
jgi:hypothetical protein